MDEEITVDETEEIGNTDTTEDENIELSLDEETEADDTVYNYQIFIRVNERPNNNSVYAIYKTEDIDGSSTEYIATTAQEIDDKVEELINTSDGKFRAKDLLIANVIPWTSDAVSKIMYNDLDLATENELDGAVEEIFSELNGIETDESEEIVSEEETEEQESVNYHIMIRIADRPNNNSLWKLYRQKDANGKDNVFFSDDKDVINAVVENMVNTEDGLFLGKDIRILDIQPWEVDAVSEIMANNILLATEAEIDNVVDTVFEQINNTVPNDGENIFNEENGTGSENNTDTGNNNQSSNENTDATEEDIDGIIDDIFDGL